MKKAILSITALLCLSAAYAQNSEGDTGHSSPATRHHIFTYYSMGYANSIYDRMNNSFIHKNYSLSSTLEARYAYFFHANWGVSLGAGLSCFAAKGTMNFDGVILRYDDPDFDHNNLGRYYNLHYKANDLVEQQRIWSLEVPLQGHFEHFFNQKYGIFASLGAKFHLPLWSRSTFPKGELTTKGYEPLTGAWWENEPPRFGKQNTGDVPATAKLRWTVDAIADFGGLLRLSPVHDLYVGVYGSYGFMDVLPKAADKKDFITPEQNRLFHFNALPATNILGEYNKKAKTNGWKTVSEKWNRWQVGIKVGIHIKPAKLGKASRVQSLRDTQKEFYARLPEYMSNTGKTIIIRDTIHVIYVYSAAPDNNTFTPAERESVSALIGIFSNSKILFDLDSDVPRIEDRSFITEAAKILQEGPSLSLIIEGYTCDLGEEAYNRNLATRRAGAIRDLFVAQGVSPAQIQVAAYTANDPQSKINITDDSRKEHRAVIFRIVKR